MKKFASVLLAVLVAFSMFSFVVSAAGASLTVSADKTTVKAGDVVTVTVKLAEKSGLSCLTLKVNYDATAFKAVEMGDGNLGFVVNKETAIATIAVTKTLEEAGTVCTLKLEALKAADSTISVTVAEACDNDYNAVEVAANTVAIKGAVEEEPSTDKPEEPSTDKPEEPSTDKPEEPSDPCEKGHKWSSWNVVKVAECKKDGLKNRNCTVCGEKEEEVIPATGKCAYKWVVTKEATATEYGEKVLKCTMCGHVKETQKLAVKQDTITNPAIPNTDAIA